MSDQIYRQLCAFSQSGVQQVPILLTAIACVPKFSTSSADDVPAPTRH